METLTLKQSKCLIQSQTSGSCMVEWTIAGLGVGLGLYSFLWVMHSDVDMLNSTTEMSIGGWGGGVCLWGWWSFEIAAGCNAFPWQPWEWHPPSHCHTANQWNLTYLPYTYLWVGLDLCTEQKNTLQAWANTDNNIQTYHHDNNNNSNNKRKQHTNIMAWPQEPLWCN